MSLSSDNGFLAVALGAASGMCIEPVGAANVGGTFELDAIHKHCLSWGNVNIPTKMEAANLRSLSTKSSGNEVIVIVKTLEGEKLSVAVDPNNEIDVLLCKLAEALGIPPEEQRLIFAGKLLEQGRTLLDYGAHDGATIHLVKRLRGGCILGLDPAIIDARFNFDFTNINDTGKVFMRGDYQYHRPCGWNRIAFNVKNKYPESNWLGGIGGGQRTESIKGEWPVSYHGTTDNAAREIGKNDFDLKKGKRFLHGRGIYSTTDPAIAEGYAREFTYKGQNYKVMIQSRVNMEDTVFISHKKYFVTANDHNIRPYGMLYKKV